MIGRPGWRGGPDPSERLLRVRGLGAEQCPALLDAAADPSPEEDRS